VFRINKHELVDVQQEFVFVIITVLEIVYSHYSDSTTLE
jgi:hypothetical protein